MKIYSGFEGFQAEQVVVTIGMFDGVHTGHRTLLNATIAKAKAISGESVVITFWPHPRIVLNKNADTLRFLTSLEEKTVIFSNIGIDHVIIIPFNEAFAQLTAPQFVKKILVEQLSIAHLVIGYNHRFGHPTAEAIDYTQLGQEFNFGVSLIKPVVIGNSPSSSTIIRQLLINGKIAEANQILGYRYHITGRVVGGMQLGRTINYPTANIEVEEPAKLIPLNGVYGCFVHVIGKSFIGMLNIGCRPTVNHQKEHRTIEVHLLDFDGDIYSESIVIELIDRIRDEQKFESFDALKNQLKCDEMMIRGFNYIV